MTEVAWQIRREGRSWSGAEALARTLQIPDHPEIHAGKLYWSDAERLTVLACLLENLGLDAVVRRLGTLADWEAAVGEAKAAERAEEVPMTLNKLAEEGARLLRDLDVQLERLYATLEKLEPDLAARIVRKIGSRELAAFLLFAPAERWGGRSMLERFVAGEDDKLTGRVADDSREAAEAMPFVFRRTDFAKRIAKRLKQTIPELKLGQAQQMVARLFGYANWNAFHRACEEHRQDGNLRELSADEMIEQAGELLTERLSRETGMTRDAALELLRRLLRVRTDSTDDTD